MVTDKVAEQHIFEKCSKCSGLGVIHNLLKVSTRAIAHLGIDLHLQKQQKWRVSEAELILLKHKNPQPSTLKKMCDTGMNAHTNPGTQSHPRGIL